MYAHLVFGERREVEATPSHAIHDAKAPSQSLQY